VYLRIENDDAQSVEIGITNALAAFGANGLDRLDFTTGMLIQNVLMSASNLFAPPGADSILRRRYV